MSIGDRVIVLDDPLNYGIGAIQEVLRDGRLFVVFPADGRLPAHRETFHAQELELASVWMRAG